MKKFFIGLLIYFISSTTFADQRSILIFLDDSENDVGAITGDLITALSQKPGPMLVSSSLLKNLFSRYEGDLKNKDNYFLQRRYYQASQAQGDAQELKYILVKALNFDKNEWVVKSVGDSLNLLVPISYLTSLGLSAQEVEKTVSNSDTSEVEIILGLKVNHQKNLHDLIEASPNFINSGDPDYFLDALNKNSLFVTRSEYTKYLVTPHTWSIFMQGHGVYNQSIVGIQLYKFVDLLNFFAQKIDTRLLVYSSCYAAGANSKAIYDELNSVAKKQLPYTIITQAITDAPTIAITPKVHLLDSGELQLTPTNLNFAKFVELVTKDEAVDYQKAIAHLSVNPQLRNDDWANLAQIRLPGTSWFSVLASPEEVVSIGTILSKTRSASEPLNVVNYFKTDPRAIVLYSSNIPFELILNSNKLDSIISMIPGDAITILGKISSTTKKDDEIIDLFMKIEGLSSRKIFHIRELNDINDVIIFINKISAGKFRTKDIEEKYACYYKRDTLFIKELLSAGNKADKDDPRVKNCLSILNKVKGKPAEIDVIDLSKKTINNYDRFIPVFDSNTIVKKIIAPNFSFFPIYAEITDKIKKGNILWVNELIVQVHDRYLDIPGVSTEQVVTLNDVIFGAHDNKSYFFTYQGKFYQEKKATDDYRDQFRKILQTSFEPEIPIQLTSSITLESIKQLQNILLKRLKAEPKSEEGKKLTNIELAREVDKLSEADKKLGREFVYQIAGQEGTIAKSLQLIEEMKKRNLLNTLLPLRYNKPLNLALQVNAADQIIESLLSSGALIDEDSFKQAIQGAVSLKTVKLMLDKGAPSDEGSHLIILAITSSSPDAHNIVKLLLQKGMSPEGDLSPSNKLLPPLHMALLHHKYEIAKTLIQNGASVIRKDHFKQSPMDLVVTAYRDIDEALKVIKMLIERGAPISENNIAKAQTPKIKNYLQNAMK